MFFRKVFFLGSVFIIISFSLVSSQLKMLGIFYYIYYAAFFHWILITNQGMVFLLLPSFCFCKNLFSLLYCFIKETVLHLHKTITDEIFRYSSLRHKNEIQ